MLNRQIEWSSNVPNKGEYENSNLPALSLHAFFNIFLFIYFNYFLELSAYRKHEPEYSHISLYKCMG